MLRLPFVFVCLLSLVGCQNDDPPVEKQPPALPAPPAARADEGEPSEQAQAMTGVEEKDQEETDPEPQAETAKEKANAKADEARAGAKPKAKAPTGGKAPRATKPKPKPESKPAPAQGQAAGESAKPAADEPAKPAADEPKARTRIPRTAHVQVDVTPRMQTLLSSDSRMQGWVNQVMGVANQCYAQVRQKAPDAGGTIVVRVTMHENSRPTPDITQLPPALSSLVACATGRLFKVRMPLFTGPEGEKSVVKLHFKP